jgi:hypothetical protein
MINHVRAAILVIALLLAAESRAECPPRPTFEGSVSIITENDKWALRGDDRHYTNGVRLGWVSPIVDDCSRWSWTRDLVDVVPFFAKRGEVRVGLALGQSLYTPGNIRATRPIANDRPYAGWLYGGFALINELRNEENGVDKLDTLEIQFGVVGPGAGGRKAQNRWHNFIGVDEAYGWSHQLPNEPGFVLYYERKWRDRYELKHRLDGEHAIDVTPHVAFSLGNVASYAAAGATLRVGRHLEVDYGAPRIRPALSGSGYVRSADAFGWYLFAGTEIRAVAYDVFLDGPLFRSGPSVDKKPIVVDLQAGVALTYRSLRAAYTYVVRTREFDTQGTPDRFGALSLTVAF